MTTLPTAEQVSEKLRALSEAMLDADIDMMLPDGTMDPVEGADFIQKQAADIERLTEERDAAVDDLCKWRSAFQDVTPGGSEFMSVDAVKGWARKLREDTHRASMERHRIDKAFQGAETALAAAAAERDALSSIWAQAKENHSRYSYTGSQEEDLRFLTLGLVGEAGEFANFMKKRWRDGDEHHEDLCFELADVLAYLIMLSDQLGLTPASLIGLVAKKQRVFIDKMEARAALSTDAQGEKE